MHWGSLLWSVKQLGPESPPSLWPWVLTGKRWLVLSRLVMEQEIDSWIGVAIRWLYQCIILLHVPTLAKDQELWVITERTRSWRQLTEISWVSVSEAHWLPPLGGFPCIPHWEEAPRKPQETLDSRLFHSDGMINLSSTPCLCWDPLEDDAGSFQGEGNLSVLDCRHHAPTLDKIDVGSASLLWFGDNHGEGW